MRLDLWLTAPLAHALGRALLDFLWEAALLAGALRAALQLGAGRSARWRHQAALACSLALPLAFTGTLALLLGGGHAAALPLTPGQPMVFTPAPGGSPPASPADWPAWIASFWMGGVMLFCSLRLAGWLRIDSMRRRGVCAAPAEWQRRLRTLADAVRVSRPVVLLESCLASVPLAIGYWRPVIPMPLGALAGLSVEQVEAILIHELAHIRRADYLVSLAQGLIEGLFFFHPAVWWISAVVRTEREYACDDVVVALRPDARVYAAALATLEQCRRPAVQLAAAANGGNLVRRIRRLLDEPAPERASRRRTPALAGALVLVAGAATALLFWPAARSFAQATPPAEAAQAAREQDRDIEETKRSLDELEQKFAREEKQLHGAKESLDQAQQLIEGHAAELEKALADAGSGSAQQEEQLRQAEQALQELKASQAGRPEELLRQQQLALQQAERRLAEAQKASEAAQAGASQQLVQQKRALEEAQEQLRQLKTRELDEILRLQQKQIADASQALEQWQGADDAKQRATLQQRLEQAQRQLEGAAQSCCRETAERSATDEPQEMPRPQNRAELASAYRKWLNEDVAYLITARERAAFAALETDAERDRFIEQFWQRRNPTPGAAENAFKEEHYRRLAYANEHFAGSVPGWRSDRGRLYITYGPPDEIDDHSGESVPRQDWRYVHIEGLGYDIKVEFFDPGKTGDYRMEAAPASRGSYLELMAVMGDAAGAITRSLKTGGFPVVAYPLAGRPGMVHVLVGPYSDAASLAKAKAALEAAGYHPTLAR